MMTEFETNSCTEPRLTIVQYCMWSPEEGVYELYLVVGMTKARSQDFAKLGNQWQYVNVTQPQNHKS